MYHDNGHLTFYVKAKGSQQLVGLWRTTSQWHASYSEQNRTPKFEVHRLSLGVSHIVVRNDLDPGNLSNRTIEQRHYIRLPMHSNDK
jgi:hypothetical protein